MGGWSAWGLEGLLPPWLLDSGAGWGWAPELSLAGLGLAGAGLGSPRAPLCVGVRGVGGAWGLEGLPPPPPAGLWGWLG